MKCQAQARLDDPTLVDLVHHSENHQFLLCASEVGPNPIECTKMYKNINIQKRMKQLIKDWNYDEYFEKIRRTTLKQRMDINRTKNYKPFKWLKQKK